MNEKDITKSYIYHSGGFEFDKVKFANFVGDFPELVQEIPRASLEKTIKANLESVGAEIDPEVDANVIEEVLVTSNADIENFLKGAHGKRLSVVLGEVRTFPFLRSASMHRIKTALRAVFAEEMADFGNDALGPYDPVESVDEVSGPKDVVDDLAPKEPGDELQPTPDDPMVSEEAAIDPKIEEDAMMTIEGYLQREVFNSKLIPAVKLVEAKPLKGDNRYVINLEFSSQDGSATAYAEGVIYNGKLILPADLETQEGERIGEFNAETFQKVFSVEEAGTPKNDNDYNSLMDDLNEAPSYTEASKVIDKIIEKFGSHVGRTTFESYLRRHAHDNNEKQTDFKASRLNVRVGETDIDETKEYTDRMSMIEDDQFLKEIEDRMAKKKKKEDK